MDLLLGTQALPQPSEETPVPLAVAGIAPRRAVQSMAQRQGPSAADVRQLGRSPREI